VEEMRWYLQQLRSSSSADPVRFARCHEAFATPRSQAIYRLWKQEGDAALVNLASDALRKAVETGSGRIEVLELGHRYGHLSALATVA
jgi:hypothetical protein